MRTVRLVTTCFAMLALAGCASSTKPPLQPVSVPATWKAQAAADGTVDQPQSDAWWREYNDVTLNRIVEQAQVANTDVRVAATRVAQAWASVEAARAERRPLIALSASPERQRTPATRLQGSAEPNVMVPPSTRNQFNAGLQANFELDLVGRLGKAVESAQAQLKANEFDAVAARLAVTNAVVQAWADVRFAEHRHRISLQLITAANAIASGESKRVAAGFGTSQTNRDAAQLVIEAKRKETDALRDREQGLARLALLLGESPIVFSARWQESADRVPPELKVAADLPAKVVERRPDIQAQWQRLSSAATDIERAQLERYPALNLTSTLGFAADRLSSWLERDAVSWVLGAKATLPFLDGGRISARVDQSKAIRNEREVLYRQSVYVALQEVESGLVQWQAVQAQLKLVKDLRALRVREMADTQRSIQAGVLNRLAYTKAELRFADTSESLATAERDAAVAYASLQTALGR
jgi:NodT family efflux transporter outer membrane factor (OMF) lipoprotein